MAQRLAQAWLPGCHVEYPTAPGSKIRFESGRAFVMDEASAVWALRREGLTFEPLPPYVEHIGTWLRRCGELQPPKARVQMPTGWTLGDGPAYRVWRTGEPPLDLVADPVFLTPPPLEPEEPVADESPSPAPPHQFPPRTQRQRKAHAGRSGWTPERRAAASAAAKDRLAKARDAAAARETALA